MKQKLIFSISIVSMALYFGFTSQNNVNKQELLLNEIEALTNNDNGAAAAYITCYCALMSDSNCAVNNNGSNVCAGGPNIKCWDYNRNCN